jgi:hypothetical protein
MPPTGDGSSIADRARTGTGVQPQHQLGEKDWSENDALLTALRERDIARESRLSANKAFKIKDDNVKAMLVDYHLDVGEQARVGEFVIKKTQAPGREVSFETSPSDRIGIKKDAEA